MNIKNSLNVSIGVLTVELIFKIRNKACQLRIQFKMETVKAGLEKSRKVVQFFNFFNFSDFSEEKWKNVHFKGQENRRTKEMW